MHKILTVTINPAIDVNTSVDNVVTERKLRCKQPRREPGGGGINVSRAIRKLGGESLTIYSSGGLTGRILEGLLDQEGLNHIPIRIQDLTRENIIVFEESTSHQYRFCMPGPALTDQELKNLLDQIRTIEHKPDYIVASGSLQPGAPTDTYAKIARIGKTLGSRVIIDTSGEPLRLALEEGVFLLKPNLRELSQLAKRRIKDEKHIEAVSKDLVDRGKCDVVVISIGAAGALMVGKEVSEHFPSPTVPIKSKVGAGDSMVGGMVLGLSQGKSLREAVILGVAAGAAAVMTPGTGLCRRVDTERLYKQMIKGRA